MAINERNQLRNSNQSRPSPQPTDLEERYGKIGIPAVKAAARYACGRLMAARRRGDTEDRAQASRTALR